jgi:hypothetical protein
VLPVLVVKSEYFVLPVLVVRAEYFVLPVLVVRAEYFVLPVVVVRAEYFVLPMLVVRAEYSVLLTQSLAARLLRSCLCCIADPHTCTRYNAFHSKDINSICNVPRKLVAPGYWH